MVSIKRMKRNNKLGDFPFYLIRIFKIKVAKKMGLVLQFLQKTKANLRQKN